MGDSLITIVAIFLAGILMFVFPLVSISEMNDNETQAMVQTYTTDFVNQIRAKGKITRDDYDSFVQKLNATGNSYDIEFEILIADTNPGKKSQNQQIGDTTYYGVYTTQIEDVLGVQEAYYLKEGDFIRVYETNNNTTISQMFKSFLYSVTGDASGSIYGDASGICTTTGVAATK